jgi:hypothetical protein
MSPKIENFLTLMLLRDGKKIESVDHDSVKSALYEFSKFCDKITVTCITAKITILKGPRLNVCLTSQF